MKLSRYISDIDSSPSVLGWRYLLEFSDDSSIHTNTFIKSSRFSDLQMLAVNDPAAILNNRKTKYLQNYRFALDKSNLTIETYEKCTSKQLINHLTKFARDTDWGDDIEYFKKSINFVKDEITNFPSVELYYLNTKFLVGNDVLLIPNFYSYYVNILATVPDGKRILVIDLGGD